MPIFSRCVFYLDPNARLTTLSPADEAMSQDFADASTHELAQKLTDCGGTVLTEFDADRCTHYVTDSAGEGCTGAADVGKLRNGTKCRFQVVSPDWVSRCIRHGRLQSWCNGLDDERHIFSTVVACLSGFRGADRARMRALIVRGGGAVTQDLTANCTHLITRELRGDKCRKAMDMTSTIFIVPAMWLWRSLQNSRKEDEDSYCARKPLKDLTLSPSTDPLLQHGHEIFLGMRFLIQAEDDTEEILDAVRSGGGQLVESADEATHIIADTMSDVCSQRPSPPRRTRAWVLECVRQRTTVWPTKSLEWKGWRFLPRPGHAIPTVEGGDGVQFVITLTGYTGIQRDVLKMLIRLTGAECTDALTKKNTHLLCNNPTSKKAVAAESWGIRVVNHLWIMDSVLMWAWQPADTYDKAGEEILAEGGWTLLGDDADDAKSMHPRFLAEKWWPLPAAEVEEEAEIAGTPEESQKAEAVRNEHDSNASNGIDETQSQDGEAAGDVRQLASPTSPASGAKACAAADQSAACSPCMGEDAQSSVQSPVHRASGPQRRSDDMSSAPRVTVSFAAELSERGSVEQRHRLPQHSKGENADDGKPVAESRAAGAAKGQEEEAVSSPRSKDEEGGELDVFVYDTAGVSEEGAAQPSNRKSAKKHDEPFASQAASNVLCQMGGGRDDGEDDEGGEDEEGGDGMEEDEHEMAKDGPEKQRLENTENPSSAGSAQVRGEDGSADKREAASSPIFGESVAVPLRNGSHGGTSSMSKRNLVREFQYDLDDDASPEERSQDEASIAHVGDAVSGEEPFAAASAAVERDSSPQLGAGAPRRRHQTTNVQAGKKMVASPARGGAVGAAAASSPSEQPVPEETARSSKRGKGKEKSVGAGQKGDVLDNIFDGQYESMAFGNYEEPAAMESVAFDGDYAPSVSAGSAAAPAPATAQPKGSTRRNAPRARASGAVDDADSAPLTSPVAQGAGLLPPKGKAGRACRGQAAAAAGSPAVDEAIETKSTVSTPAAASEGRKAGNKGRAARKAPETAAASGAPAREQQDKDAQEHEHEQEQQHAGAVKQGRAQKQVLELEEGSAGRTRGGRAKASPAAVVEQGRRSSEGKRSSESLPEDSRKRSSSEADLNAACGSMKAKAGRNAKTRPAQPVPKAAAASRSSPRRPSADSDVSGPLGSEDSAESPSRLDGSTSGGRLLGTRRIAAAKEREEGGAEGDGKADAPSRSVLGKRPSPSNEGKAPKSARTSAQATQQRREVSAKAGASSRPKPAQMSPPSGCARVISGTRVATKSKFVLVCGKTAERAEQQAAVQQLGGQSAHIHGYMEHATHILVKELRRTEKFLCACAAGRWILKPAYIVSCKLNNQWLQEQSYEWNNPRKVDKDQKDLWHGAPRRWRQYWEQNEEGPFASFKCLLMPESHPPHDVLAKIISAGSGQVVMQEHEPTLAQVQKQVSEQGVTHVIVSDTCQRAITAWLDSSKIPYFKGDYLMDFLAHKSKPSPNDCIYKPELVDKRSGVAGGSGRAKSPARSRA